MDIHIHHNDSGFQRSVIKKLNKIMATLQDFQTAFDQINQATNAIAQRITSLTEQIQNSGMNADTENSVLTQLNTLRTQLEQIAANPENPGQGTDVPTDPNAPAPTDPNQPTPTPQP